MAKINGKFICNRCGHVIKTKEDLDCQAVKMFQAKSISECCSEPDEKYSRVDTATTLHFCGNCIQDLLSHYVYGYEIKKPPITEEVVYCKDCKRQLTSECPLSFIEKQTLQFVDMRRNFFCGYGERKENGNA